MLHAYVRTIREEIFYESAKLISRYDYGALQRRLIQTDSRSFRTEKFCLGNEDEAAKAGNVKEFMG